MVQANGVLDRLSEHEDARCGVAMRLHYAKWLINRSAPAQRESPMWECGPPRRLVRPGMFSHGASRAVEWP